MILFRFINSTSLIVAVFLSSCTNSNVGKTNESNRILRNTGKIRSFKTDTSTDKLFTEIEFEYRDSTLVAYKYFDLCSMLKFRYNYTDTTFFGTPFIGFYWNSAKENKLNLEIELPRPPLLDYLYYANSKELVFENDSSNSAYYTKDSNDTNIKITLTAVFKLNGKELAKFTKTVSRP